METLDRLESAWRVIVPVKTLSTAKSRLAPHVGALRGDLALAMALDTVLAASSCAEVAQVVVVTDDPDVTSALGPTGVVVMPDEPGAGINAALRHGALVASTADDLGVVALSADLPALRPVDLSTVLRVARRHRRSFVADVSGTGTTLYAARSLEDFEPRFGPDSARWHAQEAIALTPDVPSLRRDVDTIDDLWAAISIGVGPNTAALRRLLPARSA